MKFSTIMRFCAYFELKYVVSLILVRFFAYFVLEKDTSQVGQWPVSVHIFK